MICKIEVFFSVPFTHHIRILEKTQTQEERYYYMQRCVMENLSVDGLVKIIKQDDFLHKSILPNNFVNTISDSATARKAVMMFKDEYLLDFINVEEIGERDAADIDEKVVEKEIIHNVKNFIMTFGRDFAFIGNQYHLEVCKLFFDCFYSMRFRNIEEVKVAVANAVDFYNNEPPHMSINMITPSQATAIKKLWVS